MQEISVILIVEGLIKETDRKGKVYDNAELDLFGECFFLLIVFYMGGNWVVLAMQGWEVPSP